MKAILLLRNKSAKDFHLFVIVSVLLLMALFIGLANIVILPPWEGFDELAHYSYIQQLADTYTIPKYDSKLSRDVELYTEFAPMPYDTNIIKGHKNKYTYESFFQLSKREIYIARKYIHERPSEARNYTEGDTLNWQEQHPPLYYLLLAPIYLLSKDMSWTKQLFLLRSISYLFAWLALLLMTYICVNLSILCHEGKRKAYLKFGALGIALWPFLFPSWFFVMGRLGNDSLSSLILSLAGVIYLLAFMKRGFDTKFFVKMAFIIIAGCFTKAFFIPIAFVFVCFCFINNFCEKTKQFYQKPTLYLGIIVFLVLLLSFFWHYKHWILYIQFDSFKKISFLELIRANITFFSTFVWSSTWSWVRPAFIFRFIMAFIVLIFFVLHVLSFKKHKRNVLYILPTVLFIIFIFSYNLFYIIRMLIGAGEGGSGSVGYYVHFMAAVLGVSLGIIIETFKRIKIFKVFVCFTLIYNIVFLTIISWAQILLYAGIIAKNIKTSVYVLPQIMPGYLAMPESLSRLKNLAYPSLAMMFYTIAVGIAFIVGKQVLILKKILNNKI